MTMKLGTFGFMGAFVLQAALLSWIVADRALLLANGQEVRLDVVPVDPRDLFRGDYVILSYPMSQLESDKVAGARDFTYGEPIYASLAKNGETWQVASVRRVPPESGVFLKGIVTDILPRSNCESGGSCEVYRVAYNLEQFFVPEGTGRELEALRNDQRLSVDVAVGSDGQAALKRLLVDGAPKYEERLF